MHPNISCATAGCTNAVIGQCVGYRGSCGRYYCASHSTGKLCAECARRKLEDEIAQRIYDDYLHTAERIQREVRSTFVPIIGAAALAFCPLIFISGGDGGLLIIGGLVGLGILMWLAVEQPKLEMTQAAEIAKRKPGFLDFYKTWRMEKDKENLSKGLAIAGVLAAIVFGVAAAAAKEPFRDDR